MESENFLPQIKSSIDDQLELDTKCGLGFIQGKWLQKLASKKTFLIVHALAGMLESATFNYMTGTMTTLEKQYKFTSAQLGYINATWDIVSTVVSLIAPYYCSKGRFPRWLGFSLLCFAFAYAINITPYYLYGVSDDILSLTKEFGQNFNPNSSLELIHQMKMKELCYANSKNFK
jgi:hypothetical protein